ncbi:SHOCT domain-containing protein [Mediterraneibacter agrestimuris]|nr:SHOCT domain-containing protein [Mediterraneibacter agrestimuris]
MDQIQFEQIKQHGAMLAIASRLYKCGLITNAEHRKIAAELQKNTVR